MGEGARIDIFLDRDEVLVGDFGPRILVATVVECASQGSTGGKHNDDAFQFSIRLDGVGSKAVNSLSRSDR